MKKVKPEHETDSGMDVVQTSYSGMDVVHTTYSGMDVVQTTCRPRPSGVSGKFDAVVPKSSKDGVVYTFVVNRPTFNL